MRRLKQIHESALGQTLKGRCSRLTWSGCTARRLAGHLPAALALGLHRLLCSPAYLQTDWADTALWREVGLARPTLDGRPNHPSEKLGARFGICAALSMPARHGSR